MCNVIRLHAMFKQASNKYDTAQNQDFPKEIIDDFLYDAQLDYLRQCVTSKPVNGYIIGFDSNQQRLDMIQPFISDYNQTPLYTKQRGKFTVSVFRLPKDYYMFTGDIYSFDFCGNTIRVDIVEYQNLESHLNEKDQLLWQIAYATLKGNEFHIFYPTELKTVDFNYVKLPVKTFFGQYDTLEYELGDTTFPSSTTQRINSLVPEGYCHILIDIAVANVFGNLRDYNLAQYKQNNLNL